MAAQLLHPRVMATTERDALAVVPVNFRKHKADAAVIAGHLENDIQVATSYRGWLNLTPEMLGPDAQHPLAGRRILELGPGPTLGAAVLLACAGARVTVADRFLPAWDSEFHPIYFRALFDRLTSAGDVDVGPVRAVLSAGAFSAVLDCHALPAEQVAALDGTFDIVFSNAVLEHVEDLDATVSNVTRKTAAGGAGFHQVDFRDHRNFARPLEYLTLDEQTFERLRRDHACECGCRWRMSDVAAAFEQAGFHVERHPNLFATTEYLAELRPRLHSDFETITQADLVVISALFAMTR